MSPYPLVDRIRAEFIEMPGLQLTVAQAARLFGTELSLCRDAIDTLIASAFLRRTRTGLVARAAN